jgi:type IV pilus biogenesis protein PilP
VGTTAAVLASPPPARPAGLTAKAAPKPTPAVARAAPAVRKPAVVVAKAAPAVVVRPAPVPVQQYVRQVTPQRQVPVRQASATPRPKVVSTAALVQQRPAKPLAQPAPVRQKVVAKPAPVRKAAKPAPVRTVAKPVAPQKVAAAQRPAKQQVGISRRTVSLVGVFGGADGRSALVRLPNGKIEKVKAGDRIQGVQVAAISDDSVRLTGRGKDTLLRLPD